MYLIEIEPTSVNSVGITGSVTTVMPPPPTIPEEQKFYMLFVYTDDDRIWQPVYNTIRSDDNETCEHCNESPCCDCCDCNNCCDCNLESEAPMYETIEEAQEQMAILVVSATVFSAFKIVEITL